MLKRLWDKVNIIQGNYSLVLNKPFKWRAFKNRGLQIQNY